MRHQRRSTTIPSLAAGLDDMVTVVEHRRHHLDHAKEETTERRLRECVTVMVWEEADGSETISVVGNSDMSPIQMKGALYDGIYALVHDDAQYSRTTTG